MIESFYLMKNGQIVTDLVSDKIGTLPVSYSAEIEFDAEKFE